MHDNSKRNQRGCMQAFKENSQSTLGNLLNFSIFGSKELQVSKYSALNPSMEKRISGGRVNLQENTSVSSQRSLESW